MTEEKELDEKVLDALKAGEATLLQTTDLDTYIGELEDEIVAAKESQAAGKKWVVNALWDKTFISMKGEDDLKATFAEFWVPKVAPTPTAPTSN